MLANPPMHFTCMRTGLTCVESMCCTTNCVPSRKPCPPTCERASRIVLASSTAALAAAPRDVFDGARRRARAKFVSLPPFAHFNLCAPVWGVREHCVSGRLCPCTGPCAPALPPARRRPGQTPAPSYRRRTSAGFSAHAGLFLLPHLTLARPPARAAHRPLDRGTSLARGAHPV